VSLIGVVVFLVSKLGAPEIYDGLVHTTAGRFTLTLTGITTLGSGICLAGRWYGLARACAVLQVMLIISGWALSQYPYLVVPDLTLYEAAAPAPTLRLLLWSLFAGALLLFPSLYYLYRLFKTHALFTSS
jgi:cytochrome bd ubiquinol oxidase subunit II